MAALGADHPRRLRPVPGAERSLVRASVAADGAPHWPSTSWGCTRNAYSVWRPSPGTATPPTAAAAFTSFDALSSPSPPPKTPSPVSQPSAFAATQVAQRTRHLGTASSNGHDSRTVSHPTKAIVGASTCTLATAALRAPGGGGGGGGGGE